MSVVLVIIGLLAGGVVVSKNLIRSSRLVTVINDAKFYLNAFNTFEQKFGTIPGDMATASAQWSDAHDGDGNGALVYDRAGSHKPLEAFYAFEHLSKSGLISGQYPGTAGGLGQWNGVPGTNLPQGAVDGVGYWFTDLTAGDYVTGNSAYYDGFYPHPLRIGMETSTNTMPINFFNTPTEALKLDEKFDEGRPGIGWIRATKNTYNPNCTTTDDPSTAQYNTTYTSIACAFIITNP